MLFIESENETSYPGTPDRDSRMSIPCARHCRHITRTSLARSSGHRGLKSDALYTRLHCYLHPSPSQLFFHTPNSPTLLSPPAMAQIRGTAGYNLGHQNPFGGPGSADAASDPSPLDAIREQTSKIEDWLDTMSDPVKPYVLTRALFEDPRIGVAAVAVKNTQQQTSKQGIWKHALTPCSLLQVPSCDRPVPDRRDLYRRLAAHSHPMERSARLPA